MKKTALLLTLLCSAVVLTACALCGPNRNAGTGQSDLTNLPARFQGKLPCADCPGIRFALSLYPDHVYALERTYLGAPDKYSRYFEMGQWAIKGAGHRLTLKPADSEQAAQWQINGADSLEALAADGQPIDSSLNYTLQRTGTPVTPSLANTYWKLVGLHGKPVKMKGKAREPHLVLHADKARVAGATGCNRLVGQYKDGDGALRFSKLASTRMACPGPAMQTEQAFSTALGNVRSYRILANHLVVYDAKHTQLAVFRATAMQ